MTEQSPLELGETKQEPAYIVLQHANYTERELGRLWLNGDDAKEKAAFFVRAVNCHEALVRELEDCELSLKLDLDEWGSPRLKGTLANIRAALAKAKESRLQQQDLDEETL